MMSSDDTTACGASVKYLPAASIRCLAVLLFLQFLLTGCSTTVTYKPHVAAGPAKPVGYPVPVYWRNMTIPRPCVVIGTASVGGGQFTMFGGSIESEMEKLMQTAWEKGADAVQITSAKEPGFSRSSARLTANLLRYTNTWERIPVSAAEFAAYLKTNREHLDPIEGVWDGYESGPIRIGIMRNTSKPGRDFVGFILHSANPVWREGYKKIDIKAGAQPGSYIFNYYLDDFSRRQTTVILGKQTTFSLMVPTTEEEPEFITYSKIPYP